VGPDLRDGVEVISSKKDAGIIQGKGLAKAKQLSNPRRREGREGFKI
jgi:hypothetical protein